MKLNGDPVPSHMKSKRLGKGKSIYINCQEASEYDTVTFGRAYEQYIEKTRNLKSTLSAVDMDEILRPLLTLVSNQPSLQPVSHDSLYRQDTPAPSNGPPKPTFHKQRLLDFGRILEAPIASGDDDDEDDDDDNSSSKATSPCQLVSQIAIDNSSRNQSNNVSDCEVFF